MSLSSIRYIVALLLYFYVRAYLEGNGNWKQLLEACTIRRMEEKTKLLTNISLYMFPTVINFELLGFRKS